MSSIEFMFRGVPGTITLVLVILNSIFFIAAMGLTSMRYPPVFVARIIPIIWFLFVGLALVSVLISIYTYMRFKPSDVKKTPTSALE